LVCSSGTGLDMHDYDGSFWPDEYSFSFPNKPASLRFASAALTLRDAVALPDSESADFALFSARLTVPRPPLPDEAMAFKALAEDAFMRKAFFSALWATKEAFDTHPLWPDGRFNAALLAAEIEYYDRAIRHMRRYLVLAPDAADIAASQDKLLLWQRKAGP
jgi:hypothetical protein